MSAFTLTTIAFLIPTTRRSYMSKEKTMTLNEAIDLLAKLFKGEDWFGEVGQDQYGRPVVYVKYMCDATSYDIPDYVGGHQVLCHFVSSKLAKADDFMNHEPTSRLSSPPPLPNIPIPLTNKVMDVTDEAEL